jgi:hypothetical protein
VSAWTTAEYQTFSGQGGAPPMMGPTAVGGCQAARQGVPLSPRGASGVKPHSEGHLEEQEERGGAVAGEDVAKGARFVDGRALVHGAEMRPGQICVEGHHLVQCIRYLPQ